MTIFSLVFRKPNLQCGKQWKPVNRWGRQEGERSLQGYPINLNFNLTDSSFFTHYCFKASIRKGDKVVAVDLNFYKLLLTSYS